MRECAVGNTATLNESPEEFGQSGKMLIGQTVVEAREIRFAYLQRDACRLVCLLGENVEVLDAPVAGFDQLSVDVQRFGDFRGALGDPDGEDEREAGPLFPGFA